MHIIRDRRISIMSKPTGYAITRQEVVRMVHFLSSFCDDSTCPHMCAGRIEWHDLFLSRDGWWIQMEPAMILSDFPWNFLGPFDNFWVQIHPLKRVSEPLGVAGDSVEYKWAEADGSVTSMSPTGSKVCFFLGCFHVHRFIFVWSLLLFFWRPRIFCWVKVGVPSSQEVVVYVCPISWNRYL